MYMGILPILGAPTHLSCLSLTTLDPAAIILCTLGPYATTVNLEIPNYQHATTLVQVYSHLCN